MEHSQYLDGMGEVIKDSELDPDRAIPRGQAQTFTRLIREGIATHDAARQSFGARAADISIALRLRGVSLPRVAEDARSTTYNNTAHVGAADSTRIPCPSACFGEGPFTVHRKNLRGTSDSSGAVNVYRRELFAPFDNSPGSVAVRAHEYAHLASFRVWPKLMEVTELVRFGLWENAYQCCMDNIANAYARSRGVWEVNDIRIPTASDGISARMCAAMQTASINPREVSRFDLPARLLDKVTAASARLIAAGARSDSPLTFDTLEDIARTIVEFSRLCVREQKTEDAFRAFGKEAA